MGGRGSKGSRSVKQIFRKNTAKESERLYNQQTQAVRELQILRRSYAQKIAKAGSQVEKMQLSRESKQEENKKRAEINAFDKKIMEAIEREKKKRK